MFDNCLFPGWIQLSCREEMCLKICLEICLMICLQRKYVSVEQTLFPGEIELICGEGGGR